MQKILILSLMLLTVNNITGQNILSSAFITNGVVNLGQTAGVQFNVNMETLCDTYTIESQIDYFVKTIKVNVNYLYIASCNESIVLFTEMPNTIPLLEGIYTVSVELSVPNDITLNETLFLGTITVFPPTNTSCNTSIPTINEPCPILSNPVCACDGQNYTNECEAFFAEQSGKYYDFNCGNYLISQSQNFDCATFSNTVFNTFERYSCIADDFPGPEFYLSYQHNAAEEPVDISFTGVDNLSNLFLVSINNGNLSCLQISENNQLILQGLPSGPYFLVFDSKNLGQQSVEFCVNTNTSEPLLSDALKVYPNPSNQSFTIALANELIERVTIYNSLGQEVLDYSGMNSNVVEHNLTAGIYQLLVKTKSGKLFAQKVVVKQ